MKRFLIVDDDPRMVALVTAKLEMYADCTVALDGEEAVLQFERNVLEQTPFDAVFMDIEMPQMDGHQVVRKMRDIERKHGINPLHSFKLVMLTAHNDVKNVSRSFFRGSAEAYIHKAKMAETFHQELEKIHLI